MLLNILGVSVSNVLKTFVDRIVSIACTFVIFHSHKPTARKKVINIIIIN